MAGSIPTDTPRTAHHDEAVQRLRSLVDLDPDLVAGIPAPDEPLARRALARPLHALSENGSDIGNLLAGEGVFGLLLVGGAVVRELEVAGRTCAEILGPGDVIGAASPVGSLEIPIAWRTMTPAAVVALDARFTAAAQRWPSLSVNLHRRLLDQAHRSAVHAAIAQLPRVERRLLSVMWQLADRWGHVTPFGVEVDLALTHEALGRLIGAQRPTVTLALAELARDGAMTRTVRRTWLLSRDSRDLVACTGIGRASGAPAPTA